MREPLLVFYDGACAMCSGSVAWALRHDRDRLLRPIAAQSEEARARAGAAADRLLEELHAWSPREGLRVGTDALAALLDRLPGWRWAGALLRVPPIRSVARPVYRWIARRRDRAASCPLPSDHAGCGLEESSRIL